MSIVEFMCSSLTLRIEVRTLISSRALVRAESFRDRFDLVLLRSVSRAVAHSRRVENCPLGILVGSTIGSTEEEVDIEDGKETIV